MKERERERARIGEGEREEETESQDLSGNFREGPRGIKIAHATHETVLMWVERWLACETLGQDLTFAGNMMSGIPKGLRQRNLPSSSGFVLLPE